MICFHYSNKSQFHNVISACESDNSLSTSSESDCESEDAVLMHTAGWLDLYFYFIYLFFFIQFMILKMVYCRKNLLDVSHQLFFKVKNTSLN